MTNSPYNLYTPAIREPMPIRSKAFLLPAPPEQPEKPQKINWLRTLLPPFIMFTVLFIVSIIIDTQGFVVYTMIMMTVYPMARVIAFWVQKNEFDKREAVRKEVYLKELNQAVQKINSYIRRQRNLLLEEFPETEILLQMAESQGDNRKLWDRIATAHDFLSLRLGLFTGKPAFDILIPKGDDVDSHDPFLAYARDVARKYQELESIPFLIDLKEIGSLALIGPPKFRDNVAKRLLLDLFIHHRPDEVEVFLLSDAKNARQKWAWMRWLPHCNTFEMEKMFEEPNLGFQKENFQRFLNLYEDYIPSSLHKRHQILVVDVDGIQQYGEEEISKMLRNARNWNVSLLFVGANPPKSVRGIVKPRPNSKAVYIDTLIDTKNKVGEDYFSIIELDTSPTLKECNQYSRSLAAVKLLSSSSGSMLTSNETLFDVLQLSQANKLTHRTVFETWVSPESPEEYPYVREFRNEELLRFPIGNVERNGKPEPFELNLSEARFGGKDAYHTMLIGTTGSGKSEFIKSFILGGAYKYPPQYLNFFCMDFKGGSTIDDLEVLPHVVGVITNLDEVLAQRGLIAIAYEIDRRQALFSKESEKKSVSVKDIWDYNADKTIDERLPHLIIILDEFTRGLDMLNSVEFNLQELLEKRLVNQGRSLGIYLVLANQIANAKATKLLPNVGWRIGLRTSSDGELNQFIDSSVKLKSPRYQGRGYVQAIGELPVEFQSGYSGAYVQYENFIFDPKKTPIYKMESSGKFEKFTKHELETKEKNGKDELKAFLQIHRVVDSIQMAIKELRIPRANQIYSKPLPCLIGFPKPNEDEPKVEIAWNGDESPDTDFVVKSGYLDNVKKCEQIPFTLDFINTDPHLLFVGNQEDVVMGFKSIYYPLCYKYSPKDVQFYFLEFGIGMRSLLELPHQGDLIFSSENERVARVVEYFDHEFKIREEQLDGAEQPKSNYPHLFLVVNNIAGVKGRIAIYEKITKFIVQGAHKFGIHVVLMALPQSTGNRSSFTDLRQIKSRIVFPSINSENFATYLGIHKRKLLSLTGMENGGEKMNDVEPISRAYFLSPDEEIEAPVEIQLATPLREEMVDDVAKMWKRVDKKDRPACIETLKDSYVYKPKVHVNVNKQQLTIGKQWSTLEDYKICLEDLPSLWGISGLSGAGKTNFLSLLVSELSQFPQYSLDIMCLQEKNLLIPVVQSIKGCQIHVGAGAILERLNDYLKVVDEKAEKRILFIDDLNFFWDRKTDKNDEIVGKLDELGNETYGKDDLMIIAGFNYSQKMKNQKNQSSFLVGLHENNTGINLGLQNEWLLSTSEISKYRSKLVDNNLPNGRGIAVFEGVRTEIQTFWYGGEND